LAELIDDRLEQRRAVDQRIDQDQRMLAAAGLGISEPRARTFDEARFVPLVVEPRAALRRRGDGDRPIVPLIGLRL
jgi:hypothetical protein